MKRINGIFVCMSVGVMGCATTEPMQKAQPQTVYVQQPTAPAPPPNQEYNAQAAVQNGPKWVRIMGCDAASAPDSKGKVCGVGSHLIESARRMNIARSAAIAAGTKQIAINLSQEVKAMLEQYEGEFAAEQGSALNGGANFESRVQQVVRQVSNLSLSGIRCADTWIGPDNNFYALMIADPDAVKTALTQMKGLSEQMQATINRHADEMFQKLDAATAAPAPAKVE